MLWYLIMIYNTNAPTNTGPQPKRNSEKNKLNLKVPAGVPNFENLLSDSAYILASISIDESRSQAAFTALCTTYEKKQIVHKTLEMLPAMFMLLSRAKLKDQNRYMSAELIKALEKAVVSEPTEFSTCLSFPLEDKGYGSLSKLISSYLKESSLRNP